MEQRGLLDRRDGRGKAILHQATSAGLEMLRLCDRVVAQTMQAALSGFSADEVRTLRDLLERLA